MTTSLRRAARLRHSGSSYGGRAAGICNSNTLPPGVRPPVCCHGIHPASRKSSAWQAHAPSLGPLHAVFPVVFLSALTLFCSATASRALGTEGAFAYVTNVRVAQLSNAVRVTVEADGTIQLRQDDQLFTQFLSREHGNFKLKPVTEIHLRLENCRSKVGSFAPVGAYPIDHVAFAVPGDAQNGVGLDVQVILNVPATARRVLESLDFSGETGPGIWILLNPDRRSFTITVTSDRFAEHPVVRLSPSNNSADHSLSLKEENGLLDLDVRNERLSDVVRRVADVAGVSATVQPGADRLISAVITKRPPGEVLSLLGQAYGLELTAFDSALMLVDPASGAGGNVTTVPLRYVDAARALSQLPTFLLHFAHVDPQHNSVVVGGSPALRARVSADLFRVDRPPPECRVNAIFVSYRDSSEFARSLELARRTTDSLLSISSGRLGEPSGLVVYSRQSQSSPGVDALLTALKTDSSSHIDSRPFLRLANGQSGELFGGQSYFAVLNSGFYRGSGLTQIDVGTTLRVTPVMGADNWITLNLELESNDASTDPLSRLPIVQSRKLVNSMRVRGGDTIYLGGLEQSTRLNSRFKIPILGDIPLIGALFRGRRDRLERVNIAVFVTPTVIQE